LVQAKHLGGSVEFDGGFGHSINGTAGLVLGDGVASGAAQGVQTSGAITPHSGQENPNHLTGPMARNTVKENVHRRAVGTIFWLKGVVEAPRSSENQVLIAASE
jgi:hypothetical protein